MFSTPNLSQECCLAFCASLFQGCIGRAGSRSFLKIILFPFFSESPSPRVYGGKGENAGPLMGDFPRPGGTGAQGLWICEKWKRSLCVTRPRRGGLPRIAQTPGSWLDSDCQFPSRAGKQNPQTSKGQAIYKSGHS